MTNDRENAEGESKAMAGKGADKVKMVVPLHVNELLARLLEPIDCTVTSKDGAPVTYLRVMPLQPRWNDPYSVSVEVAAVIGGMEAQGTTEEQSFPAIHYELESLGEGRTKLIISNCDPRLHGFQDDVVSRFSAPKRREPLGAKQMEPVKIGPPGKAKLMNYLKTAELESFTTQLAFFEAQADAVRYQIERRRNNQLEGHEDILALVGAIKLAEREMRTAYQVYERIAADYAARADEG